MRECVEQIIAECVFLRVTLDASTLVTHVNEHGFAHVSMRGNAAGDGNFRVLGQRAAFKFRARLTRADVRREFVFARVNACGAQGGENAIARDTTGASTATDTRYLVTARRGTARAG